MISLGLYDPAPTTAELFDDSWWISREQRLREQKWQLKNLRDGERTLREVKRLLRDASPDRSRLRRERSARELTSPT
jgi:hypothetical protein